MVAAAGSTHPWRVEKQNREICRQTKKKKRKKSGSEIADIARERFCTEGM